MNNKSDLEKYLEIRRKRILEGMPYPAAADYAYNVVYELEGRDDERIKRKNRRQE